MAEENQLSTVCFYYQMFMERAYGTITQQKPSLQCVGMRNLIMAEKGIVISPDSVLHFEEQLGEIKKNVEEALQRLMALPNAPGYVTMELMWYKYQAGTAAGSEELMKIILDTIDITNTLYKIEQ